MALRARSGGCVAAGRSVSPVARSTGGSHPGGAPAALCGGHPKILPKRFAGRISGTHPPPATPGAAWLRPARPTETPQPRPSLARRLPGRTLAPDGRLEPAGALPPHPRPSLRRQPRAIMLRGR